MPFVNIKITKGATRAQKQALVRGVTDLLVEVLGKDPTHTHIVIENVELEDWGFAGMLTDEYRKLERQAGARKRSAGKPGKK